jgi:hypothetical protein
MFLHVYGPCTTPAQWLFFPQQGSGIGHNHQSHKHWEYLFQNIHSPNTPVCFNTGIFQKRNIGTYTHCYSHKLALNLISFAGDNTLHFSILPSPLFLSTLLITVNQHDAPLYVLSQCSFFFWQYLIPKQRLPH